MTSTIAPLKIAIMGAGNVGGGLGAALAARRRAAPSRSETRQHLSVWEKRKV